DSGIFDPELPHGKNEATLGERDRSRGSPGNDPGAQRAKRSRDPAAAASDPTGDSNPRPVEQSRRRQATERAGRLERREPCDQRSIEDAAGFRSSEEPL